MFAREILYIQIAHICETKYQPLIYFNLLVLNALAINTLLSFFSLPHINEYFFLIVLLFVAAGSYVHMGYDVAMVIANELDIFIFRVNKQKNT